MQVVCASQCFTYKNLLELLEMRCNMNSISISAVNSSFNTVTTATMSKHRNRPLAVCVLLQDFVSQFLSPFSQWTGWFTRSLSERINNKKKNTNHSHEYAIDPDGIRFCVFWTGRRIGIFGHTMESVASEKPFTQRAMPICVMVNHWHIGICTLQPEYRFWYSLSSRKENAMKAKRKSTGSRTRPQPIRLLHTEISSSQFCSPFFFHFICSMSF